MPDQNASPSQGYTWEWFKGSAGAQVLVASVLFIIALWLLWSVLSTIHYRGAVPTEIELTFGLATSGNIDGCGGAILGLDEATVTSIRKQGLAFFKNAPQGRRIADTNDQQYFLLTYEPWQPTPLPDGWVSESLLGAWLGLTCMGLSPSFTALIAKAGHEPGSFYAIGRSKMLLVIPSQKLVVYTYTH
jgi:hypothetical protein